MKKLVLAAVLGGLSWGCGNNECEDAKEKAVDCGGEAAQIAAQVSDDDAAECNSTNECRAKCVNKTSCADMNGADADFQACLLACGGTVP